MTSSEYGLETQTIVKVLNLRCTQKWSPRPRMPAEWIAAVDDATSEFFAAEKALSVRPKQGPSRQISELLSQYRTYRTSV